MDTIYIHGLEVSTIIGLYDWERAQEQPLIIDIDMKCDLSSAIDTDTLNTGIDYAEVAEDIKSISKTHQFLLIEPFAEALAQHILQKYSVEEVTIKVNKPLAIKNAQTTGIQITRKKQQLIFVSIGSNIHREKNINSSIVSLKKTFHDIRLSPIYETQSVGFDGQDFYNLVASFRTEMSPEQINLRLKRIEKEHGRNHENIKFSDRTLDIDILLYDDKVLYSQGLNIPRDEILSYAFVLKPLADLVPEQLHPETKQDFLSLWNEFSDKPMLNLVQL